MNKNNCAREKYGWGDKVKAFDKLLSITEYEEISKDELNALTAEGYIIAEPYYMTKDKLPVEARNQKGLKHNALILLRKGNLKQVVGRTHCWAKVQCDINKNRYPVYHKAGGLWIWKIDSFIEYEDEDGKQKTTVLLGEQIDKGFILKDD